MIIKKYYKKQCYKKITDPYQHLCTVYCTVYMELQAVLWSGSTKKRNYAKTSFLLKSFPFAILCMSLLNTDHVFSGLHDT